MAFMPLGPMAIIGVTTHGLIIGMAILGILIMAMQVGTRLITIRGITEGMLGMGGMAILITIMGEDTIPVIGEEIMCMYRVVTVRGRDL